GFDLTTISPLVGLMRPATIRISVDLPQPLGPTIETKLFAFNVRQALSTAVTSENCLVTFEISTPGSSEAADGRLWIEMVLMECFPDWQPSSPPERRHPTETTPRSVGVRSAQDRSRGLADPRSLRRSRSWRRSPCSWPAKCRSVGFLRSQRSWSGYT